jgi:hypothetical protein
MAGGVRMAYGVPPSAMGSDQRSSVGHSRGGSSDRIAVGGHRSGRPQSAHPAPAATTDGPPDAVSGRVPAPHTPQAGCRSGPPGSQSVNRRRSGRGPPGGPPHACGPQTADRAVRSGPCRSAPRRSTHCATVQCAPQPADRQRTAPRPTSPRQTRRPRRAASQPQVQPTVPQCADSSTAMYIHNFTTAMYTTLQQTASREQHCSVQHCSVRHSTPATTAPHPAASRGIPGIPADPVASRGIPWHPVASRGIPWHPVASRGVPWRPVASRGVPRRPGGFALICLTCYKLILTLHSLLWMAWLRHLPYKSLIHAQSLKVKPKAGGPAIQRCRIGRGLSTPSTPATP